MCDIAVQKRTAYCASTEDEYLKGVSIFCGKTKGSRIFVMKFVNVPVKGAVMKCAVGYKRHEIHV